MRRDFLKKIAPHSFIKNIIEGHFGRRRKIPVSAKRFFGSAQNDEKNRMTL